MSDFTWATVSAVNPLRIIVDGDAAALPFTPDSLVDPAGLLVGSRLRCEWAGNRLVIHGRSGGLSRGSVSPIINATFRTNQRGYASGAAIPIGSYCFDHWKASGVTNLITNPSAEGTLPAISNPGITLTKDNTWAQFRTNSFKLAAAGSGNAGDNYMSLAENVSPASLGMTAGKTYTISGYCKVITPTSGTTAPIPARVRGIVVIGTGVGGAAFEADTTQAVNTAGTVTRVSTTFTIPLNTTGGIFLRVMLGATVGVVQWDGLMLTEGPSLYPYFDGSTTDCSWSGTADTSTSYNVPNVVPTLTFTADPNFGQSVTVNANARITQIVERGKMPAGTWTIAHSGTAQMRAYNNTTAPGSRPAFQTGPITFTADGTDDVVLEFSGGGAGATISQVRGSAGSSDFGFALRDIADEIRDCQRYLEYGTSKVNVGVSSTPSYITLSTRYVVTKRAVAALTYFAPTGIGYNPPTTTELSDMQGFVASRGSALEIAFAWQADAELR